MTSLVPLEVVVMSDNIDTLKVIEPPFIGSPALVAAETVTEYSPVYD